MSNEQKAQKKQNEWLEAVAIVSIRRLLDQRFRCNDPGYARLCVRQWIGDLRRVQQRPSKRESAAKFSAIARATGDSK